MFPKFRLRWTTHCIYGSEHPQCYHYTLFMTRNKKTKVLAQALDVKRHEYLKLPFALFKSWKRRGFGV